VIHLKRIHTSINIADHLTKPLSNILFHRHADYLLGHVPPRYSPVHTLALTTYGNTYSNADSSFESTYTTASPDVDRYVPSSFTTPTTAKAARMFAPYIKDIRGNPWLFVLWHE
jgi:hypothetical protein